MTAKKRSFYEDTESDLLNISWSSSDTESNSTKRCPKRLKIKSKRWIKIKDNATRSEELNNITPNNENIILSQSSIFSSAETLTGVNIFNETIDSDDESLKSSLSGCESLHESPIIGKFKLEELSPVLGSSRHKTSPVIRRNLTNKKVRRTLIKSIEEDIGNFSQLPDLIIDSKSPSPNECDVVSNKTSEGVIIECFPSQQTTNTNNLGDTTFLTSNLNESRSIIASSLTSKSSSNKSIDIISSQPKSEIIFNSDTSSSQSTLGFKVANVDLSPKKKIKYKKNGVAYNLEKALRRQQTDFAIWKHELYLQKSKGYEIAGSYKENLILLLESNMSWKEFGVTMLECKNLKNDNQRCLIVIGFNVMQKVEVNERIIVYPPYKTKSIKYKNEFVPFYFNISKIFVVK